MRRSCKSSTTASAFNPFFCWISATQRHCHQLIWINGRITYARKHCDTLIKLIIRIFAVGKQIELLRTERNIKWNYYYLHILWVFEKWNILLSSSRAINFTLPRSEFPGGMLSARNYKSHLQLESVVTSSNCSLIGPQGHAQCLIQLMASTQRPGTFAKHYWFSPHSFGSFQRNYWGKEINKANTSWIQTRPSIRRANNFGKS